MKKQFPLIISFAIGILIWFSPKPEPITPEGWQLFAVFIATIVGIILKALPMGALALIALTTVVFTHTLTLSEALSKYSNPNIWLILIAFFISRGFIKTRLGTRIAYLLVEFFGKSSLALSYCLVISEAILSVAIPSITARSGGIIYPIANSLSLSLGSKPNDPSASKIGTFLILVCFQASVISSAMFLTAMAANPIIFVLAKNSGVNLSWSTWALAACVPGVIALVVVPLAIYFIAPPQLKRLPNARSLATQQLKELGKMSAQEWIMLSVFVLLITLWVFGNTLQIEALSTAILGVSILLITGVLSFNELLEEKAAWGTFFWFGALLALASFLDKFGVIGYFSTQMSTLVSGMSWPLALSILALVYFYSHYFFASSMAHVGAMYSAFLSVAILAGAPPFFAAMLFAFSSNLFGGLTHYGIGNAPVLYGSGYVKIRQWWRVGFIISLINILIWTCAGGVWWKFLGFLDK